MVFLGVKHQQQKRMNNEFFQSPHFIEERIRAQKTVKFGRTQEGGCTGCMALATLLELCKSLLPPPSPTPHTERNSLLQF